MVLGEHDRLRRAVGNLLDNALKYGDASPVEVRVADGRVTVGDRGPGIDPAHHERIFDRFHRTPDSRGAPGSGLGLAIVKQIAESHRGTIRAESRPWGGTAFTLDLPTTDGA
ncbi:MAG: sensor histidine kinase [Nitriliruptorales bacterium]